MIMNDLSKILRFTSAYSQKELKQYGIGTAEQTALMYLAKFDQVNQESIAKHYMIDKGAIAKTLSKLEQKQLITREINVNNQREKIIYLTDKGKEIITQMKMSLNKFNALLYKGISDENLALLEKLLKQIADNAINNLSEGE